MLTTRKQLEDKLKEIMIEIKDDKKVVDQIKKRLLKYNITEGTTQRLFIYPEEIKNIDLRFLCLFAEEMYNVTKKEIINPKNHFTDTEIKSSKAYDGTLEVESPLKLPLTLKNVLMINNEDYITKMDIKFIKKLMDSKLLRYNFETQREAKFVKRKDTIEKVININKKSVNEICNELLKGNLFTTTITFNCLAGTSDSGDELIYDAKSMELIITEGTQIDIIDGYHRVLGALKALEINPELDFEFQVAIKNYNIRTAQQYIAQIATVNEINKTHIESLKASRRSDDVVRQLQRESDLGELISTSHIFKASNKIVSYKILADTIEEEFDMKTKRDAMEVAEYLIEFFDYLLGSYPDAFITDYNSVNKKSLINANPMFAGYIVLAKRMKDEGIKISKLTKILDQIDFSRDNKQWEKLNIVSNGVLTRDALKNIKKYFKDMKLEVAGK